MVSIFECSNYVNIQTVEKIWKQYILFFILLWSSYPSFYIPYYMLDNVLLKYFHDFLKWSQHILSIFMVLEVHYSERWFYFFLPQHVDDLKLSHASRYLFVFFMNFVWSLVACDLFSMILVSLHWLMLPRTDYPTHFYYLSFLSLFFKDVWNSPLCIILL